MPLVIFLLLLSPQIDFEKYIVASNRYDCLLVRDPEESIQLDDLLNFALDRGFHSIRLQGGAWNMDHPVVITQRNDISIRGNPADPPVVLAGDIEFKQVTGLTIENLTLAGELDLEQTEHVIVRSVVFRQGGIRMRARRCNQPNECTDFNRDVLIEYNRFEDCERGIFVERLEQALFQNNRFVGDGTNSSCERTVNIEFDGKNEDLDRPLELGHLKGNLILHNYFEQVFATGVRIRDSWGNTIRDNHFSNSYRSIELYEDSRYNQVISNYIEYLSQFSPTAACHAACGIYLGPGTLKNLLLNNFFEQQFELKFLERNRNTIFVLDESGKANVIGSDFR